MQKMRETISAGRDFQCTQNLKEIVDKAGEECYDFVVSYVTHPLCCLDQQNLPDKLPIIQRPDVLLSSADWSRLVVAKISPWIDVDSDDARIRALSEEALRSELSYFNYLCIPAIVIELKSEKNINLSKIINEFIEAPGGSVIWMVVPICISKPAFTNGYQDGDKVAEHYDQIDDDPANDTWQWFHHFRLACDNKQRLALVLKITADLPEEYTKLKRWMGEPLKAISIDTSVFLTNEKSFPVLTRNHQNLIKELYSLNIQVVVTGASSHVRPPSSKPSTAADEGAQPKPCLYLSYLNHLYKTRPLLDPVSEWALGYEDTLQIPLQPLGDNLESQIYETFEKDPVKYKEYQNAITKALEEVKKKSQEQIVLMVLGAGRGPLMTASIEAMNSLDVKAKLYVVEKNPNAVVTLNYMNEVKWQKRVTVIHSDMRDFRPTDECKADIIVSELLGSFGDNELSPECLDGAAHLMKDDCICIPSSYTSFVAPLHSPKLHQAVRLQAAKETNPMNAFESSYVVRVHNHFLPDEPQSLFTFSHPNRNKSSNDRFEKLTFTASECCDVCGLVGYFKATLYGDIELSILPKKHTTGMFSWFPIFFPFKDSIYVKKGEKIVVAVWRCSDARQVWYEWCLQQPVQTPIMNTKGRSYAIRKV